MSNTFRSAKQLAAESKAIASDVEAFLASGGTITQCKSQEVARRRLHSVSKQKQTNIEDDVDDIVTVDLDEVKYKSKGSQIMALEEESSAVDTLSHDDLQFVL